MNPDETYYQRLKEFYDFALTFNKRKLPRGVFKFKTFEEARQHRQTLK